MTPAEQRAWAAGESRRDWRKIALQAVLLGLAALPLAYNATMLELSGDLTADWFLSWIASMHGVSMQILNSIPGIFVADKELYGDFPIYFDIFAHFAVVDTAWAVVFGLMTVFWWHWPRLGESGEETVVAKLFQRVDKRNGKYGGIICAIVSLFGLPLAIYFALIHSLTSTGQFFIDAHYYCVAYDLPWWSRFRHCLEYAEYDFPDTVFKLGWTESLATIAVPLGIWLTMASAIYPVWLIRRKLQPDAHP